METQRIVFDGVKECSSVTGIPIELLVSAKSHPDCPHSTEGGFSDGRKIYATDSFKQWIEDHKDELESVVGTDREYWLTRRAKTNALLDEMELEERRNRTLNKKDVIDTYDRVGAALVSLFNSKLRQELPARWNLPPDKIAELDGFIAELFSVIQKGGIRWKQ